MSVRGRIRAVIAACVLVASAVPADAPPKFEAPSSGSQHDYESAAIDAYGSGYALIERAKRFDQDALAASDDRARENAQRDAAATYEEALAYFEQAVALEPSMYESHTYLGYANRRIGRFEAALKAYAAALKIKSDYAPAIEYEGEAYLGLNRFEDAKRNYLRLYAIDMAQANRLLEAMREWATHARVSEQLGDEALTAAKVWLASRPASAAQSASAAPAW